MRRVIIIIIVVLVEIIIVVVLRVTARIVIPAAGAVLPCLPPY